MYNKFYITCKKAKALCLDKKKKQNKTKKKKKLSPSNLLLKPTSFECCGAYLTFAILTRAV